MANLITVTEEQNGSVTYPTAKTKLLGVAKIQNVVPQSAGTKSLILTDAVTEPTQRVCTETVAAVLALQNTAATKTAIALTVKKIEGEVEGFLTAEVRNFTLADVVEVFADPADANDSVVVMAHPNKSSWTNYIVDETVAAILVDSEA